MHNYSDIHKIAKNYSKSLFELALKDGVLDKVYAEFTDFYQLYTQSRELSDVLNGRLLSNTIKQEIAESILSKYGDNKLVIKFVSVLISSNRIVYIGEIHASFQRLFYKEKNLIAVEIVSESKIPAKLESDLTGILESKYNKTVKLTKSVDEKILGGFIMKVESNLIDASLRNNIHSLKESGKKIINNYLN